MTVLAIRIVHARFSDRTPMRANIVGPPDVATSRASIAACHSAASCSAFGSLMIPAGVIERDKLATAGQRNWIVKPTLPTAIANGASPSCRIRSWSLSASAVPYRRQSGCNVDTVLQRRRGCSHARLPMALAHPTTVLAKRTFHFSVESHRLLERRVQEVLRE